MPVCGVMWAPGRISENSTVGARPAICGMGTWAMAAMVAGQRAAFSATISPLR
jgi:hypothetical protein